MSAAASDGFNETCCKTTYQILCSLSPMRFFDTSPSQKSSNRSVADHLYLEGLDAKPETGFESSVRK